MQISSNFKILYPSAYTDCMKNEFKSVKLNFCVYAWIDIGIISTDWNI